MLPTPCWIVSDTHLGATPPEVERELLGLLRSARANAKSLILNGDVFDFWYEWRMVMPRHGYRVVAALAELAESGMPVVWTGGNHDAWGGEMLRRDVGVDFRLTPWRGMIGHWNAHIEHGDGLREVEDRAYRRFRSVLRARWAMTAFRWLHPDFASRLALGTSKESRVRSGVPTGSGLERVAMERLATDPGVDLVAFGHTHVRRLVRASGGGVYVNPGGWDQGGAFVRVLDDRVELRVWTGSGEGECLDALERLPQEADRER